MPIKKRPVADFPEIISVGRRIRTGRLPTFRELSVPVRSTPVRGETVARPTQEDDDEEQRTFVPPIVPQVIEEIVATAPRVARFPFGAVGGGLAAGAFSIAAIFDRLSQQRLDEAGRIATRETFARPDTPVATIEPEVLPEVIVTARRISTRPAVRPQLFRFLSPDDDPFVMQPVEPRFIPTVPEVSPEFSVEIPTLPRAPTRLIPFPVEIPLRRPGTRVDTRARPVTRPQTRPATDPQPFVDPLADPQPLPQPRVDPQTDPLTVVGPRVVGFPRPTGSPFPFVLPFAQPREVRSPTCPPCPKTKKKKKKKRSECFKKLVKEGLTEDLDTEFNWVRIDCATGREL